MTQAVLLQTGTRLWFDGELVEVTQVEALRVALRETGGRWRTVALTDFWKLAAVAGVELDCPGELWRLVPEPDKQRLAPRARAAGEPGRMLRRKAVL